MAPPKEKIAAAMRAMKAIGIPTRTVKPVLKNLLTVYENNWEYIEAENFRVLADAVLDLQESKMPDGLQNDEPMKKKNHDDVCAEKNELGSYETENYKKRLRTRSEMMSPMPPTNNSAMNDGKRPKVEEPTSQMDHRSKRIETSPSQIPPGRMMVKTLSPQPTVKSETRELLSPQGSPTETRALVIAHGTNLTMERPVTYIRSNHSEHERLVLFGETTIEKEHGTGDSHMPIAEMQNNESPIFEVPLAVICPPQLDLTIHRDHQEKPRFQGSSTGNHSTWQNNGSEVKERRHADEGKGKESASNYQRNNTNTSDLVNFQDDSPTNVEIAASASGAVKLQFSCTRLHRSDFSMPSMEAICKELEDRCLKSYKILEPKFSLMNLLNEMCQCFLDLTSKSEETRRENVKQIVPALESLKRSGVRQVFGSTPACFSNDSPNISASYLIDPKGSNDLCSDGEVCGTNITLREKKKEADVDNNSRSLMMVPLPQPLLGDMRPVHDLNDITKGEERIKVSIVNEVSSEKYPPSFNYIPRNVPYQQAYISISLARIGDEDCCSDCFGNCLASPIPCPCARETGGEFAYTTRGLVKNDFLDACILMLRTPSKHHYFYCKDCPLERAKNEVRPEPCKGHVVRKFIKECWSKCGCSMQCGNRIVQRGITQNLQVFLTPEGKGWGLRSLDKLPRGAFVCEYVGEILTNMELYDRTIQTTGNAKHTYPVLLDADWGTEGVLKDEDALCLDATFYGNVARFINHRCSDANLIEIPVEVETPDHHYYHLAFFTSRKIEPFEELTWDYGIDFDDHNHPVKAFQCRCGSQLCRDMKRTSRTRWKQNLGPPLRLS
ncbi:probable inactive histone-lysine N-methyltransferase SUVR2 isoform X2 [Typha angustifolia]|uniref:probable inactive histone-lysine N-methyltransferase SUVR2 isoform X2 n=1 Tax=Typha angustifolia TaxID=59011 RepID=UPI003C2B649C